MPTEGSQDLRATALPNLPLLGQTRQYPWPELDGLSAQMRIPSFSHLHP